MPTHEVQLPGGTINGWVNEVMERLDYEKVRPLFPSFKKFEGGIYRTEAIIEPGVIRNLPFIEPKVRYRMHMTYTGSTIWVTPSMPKFWSSIIFTITVLSEDGKLINWK